MIGVLAGYAGLNPGALMNPEYLVVLIRLISVSGISSRNREAMFVARLPVQHASLRMREIKTATRTRERHIHQSPFFFQAFLFGNAVFMGKQTFFEAGDEHGVKFKALSGMHRHHCRAIGPRRRLMFDCLQRACARKRCKCGKIARLDFALFSGLRTRSVRRNKITAALSVRRGSQCDPPLRAHSGSG